MGRVGKVAGSCPRTGLVLGAGGVLGAAWITGALPALQERMQCVLNDVDVIVGTSAGSVVAAALRCGVSVEEMVAHQRGTAAGVMGQISLDDVTTSAWPPPPQFRIGSPKLMLTSLLAPHRVPLWVGATAFMPRGRGNHDVLRGMVHALHSHALHSHAPHPHTHAPRLNALRPHARSARPRPARTEADFHWVDRGRTWIVAVDYDSGQRVVFGQDGAPKATLADAVVASCSIPGWYQPAVINGRRYVDGGVRSPHSVSVLAQAGVDEVFVLAPMASTNPGRTFKPHERLERRLRSVITLALQREVRALRALGIRVSVLTPGPEDLAGMGANLMDPRRRVKVFETSLRTSASAVAGWRPERDAAA